MPRWTSNFRYRLARGIAIHTSTLAGLCRYGFPYGDLSKEGRRMVDEYMKEYRKRCSNGDGSWEPKPPPSGGFKGRL